MSNTCAARSCLKPTAGYSQYCTTHKHRQTRHGHPDQKAVTAYDLRAYLQEVAARRSKAPASPAWVILEGRWQALVSRALQVLQSYQAGAVSLKHEVEAARIIQSVAGAASSQAAIDTALAMFLMWRRDPRRFASDDAFQHQLVKRVAALGPRAVGTSWDHQRGRARSVYRDMPPRAVEILARQLIEAFGRAGMQLADMPLEEAKKLQDENQRLDDALAAMK